MRGVAPEKPGTHEGGVANANLNLKRRAHEPQGVERAVPEGTGGLGLQRHFNPGKGYIPNKYIMSLQGDSGE